MQIGGDIYDLPRQSSERNYHFSDNLDSLRALPKEGVLYRFFLIEDDVQNILKDILNMRTVAENLRHYKNTFQADISCFGSPQPGRIIGPPKAKT